VSEAIAWLPQTAAGPTGTVSDAEEDKAAWEVAAKAIRAIHAAKGLEFDNVWLVGLAEEVLPSWQSLKPGAQPAELEEERRNCFVAITRTKKQLVLSHAGQYRGWQRKPSRFLAEMNVDPSN
jgi:DNA helicase-2/ATP-dependent DNA helicase PcrA